MATKQQLEEAVRTAIGELEDIQNRWTSNDPRQQAFNQRLREHDLEIARRLQDALDADDEAVNWEREADAPDCVGCGASNAGSRTPPHLCETCRPVRVHLLVVTHRHGDSVWVCDSAETARQRVTGYVEEWWAEDGPRDINGDRPARPEDPDDLVRAYFEDSTDESYSISEEPIIRSTEDSA